MRNTPACTLSASLLLSAAMLAGCAADFGDPASEDAYKHHKSKEKTIQLGTGITMTYQELGDRRGRETVILLHCYTDTNRSFLETAQELAQEDDDLRIFVLDLRGHGKTSMPSAGSCAEEPEKCFEPEDMAADVFDFMNRKGIWRAHLVGHSMGSFVAQEMALTQFWRVESMTLIGTTANAVGNPLLVDGVINGLLEGFWRPSLEAQNPGFQWPEDAYLLKPADADPAAEDFLAANWVVDPTADTGFLADVLVDTLDIRLGSWIGAARALAAIDNRDRLTRLRVPTLILWGIQDGTFPEVPDQAGLRASLDEAVDDCKTEYFFKTYGVQPLPASGFQESDIGHAVQWSAPEAVAADIAKFVDDGEPTNDLVFSDPNDISRVIVQSGAANVIERRRPSYCN